MKFAVARNERTSLYEVHKAGCAHLNLPHMDVMVGSVEASDGVTLAENSAYENEGCGYTTGPCVQRGKRETFWSD